jgi:hypothetical protein
MHNPVEMMPLWNPLGPAWHPVADRSANKSGHTPRENHGGDLDQIRKTEDLIEQMPFELLEVRHHVLPDCDPFDFCPYNTLQTSR